VDATAGRVVSDARSRENEALARRTRSAHASKGGSPDALASAGRRNYSKRCPAAPGAAMRPSS